MIEYRSKEIWGNFYENKGKPLTVVIGGSRPGLPAPISSKLLEYLQENYNLLLLSYYGVNGLPQSLERIPLEYFVNAVNYVKDQYNIEDKDVIIIGQSKGGEAALVLTNYLKSAITIACVPGCFVFQGLPNNLLDLLVTRPKSSWTYNNKELPFIKFSIEKGMLEEAKNKNYCRCYEKSIDENYNNEAVIDINNYSGKVFMLSAEKDKYWPSKKMSELLFNNSRRKEYVNHLCLDLEGHYFLDYEESVNEIINYLKENRI